MYRLVVDAETMTKLDRHLDAARPVEDGAFLLLRIGRGDRDTRLISRELLLPDSSAWEARGRHRLRPSAQWLSAALGGAIEDACAVAFIHSHPDEHHPPGLSPIDSATSRTWASTILPLIDAPFVSMVWTPAGLAGWVFEPADPAIPHPIDRIEVAGAGTSKWVHRPEPSESTDEELDDRQARALTALGNDRIRELAVCVVGAGGTGSPLAEQLVRMGVRRVILIDPDRLDDPSNVRRVAGARLEDVAARRHKADVVAKHLRALELGTEIAPLVQDVRTVRAKAALLDSDVVFVTTDTHSSRAFVNQIAVQYYLPTIDVGVVVGLDNTGNVTGMPTELRILLPDTGCLWCRGTLDPNRLAAENLPNDDREARQREGYVPNLGPQPAVTPLNHFAASAALLAMLRMYSGDPVAGPAVVFDAWEQYTTLLAAAIDTRCICAPWRGAGDGTSVPVLA